jgi:N-formylglutamate deformylase
MKTTKLSKQRALPDWVVLHVPHDSTFIPPEVRDQFILSDTELSEEICRMTDHLTKALFTGETSESNIVSSNVSRLVVDVERFSDDSKETMAALGMGAIYRATSSLKPLRRDLLEVEKLALMEKWYYPHHQKLEDIVTSSLEKHGKCLVIDCHSFPSEALPYEQFKSSQTRPDICIGTDTFHTNEMITNAFVKAFREKGWSVEINKPFAGALVPASRYRKDARVKAVMIEINRKLYLDEKSGISNGHFRKISSLIRTSCYEALQEDFFSDQ